MTHLYHNAVRPVKRTAASRRRGFTLVEAAMSLVILSTLVVVALQTVTSSRGTMRVISDRAKALMIAEYYLTEVLDKAYVDPAVSINGSLGAAGGETRATYNDVDDYHNAAFSPPTYANGSTIAGCDSSWRVEIQTPFVDLANLTNTRSSHNGAKRITVTVKRNGVTLAQVVALRTYAWPGLDGSQYHD